MRKWGGTLFKIMCLEISVVVVVVCCCRFWGVLEKKLRLIKS
jgi:hypothetical protein